VNQTLLDLLCYDHHVLRGQPVDFILTKSSRMFFRIYFTPLILLNTKVDEMFLTLQTSLGTEIPVLLNAVRRDIDGIAHHECVLFPIHRQREYEQRINQAEAAAVNARHQLKFILAELEDKKQSLAHLEAQIRNMKNQQ
jgi:phosphoserine phosphatase RsbU/P